MNTKPKAPQLLHMVVGGEMETLYEIRFKDLDALDVVGFYPNYDEALVAWRAKAQQTVDNAHMRYFIFHMHKLLNPGPAS